MVAYLRKLMGSLMVIAIFKARYTIIDQIDLEFVDKDNYCMEKTNCQVSMSNPWESRG